MMVIGMDVHQRYCQVALLEDDSTEPKELRLNTERAELEEFAREHEGARVAFEASRNHRFVYECLEDRTAAKNRVKAVLAERGVTYTGDVSSQQGREFLADEELPLSAADRQVIEADLAVIETVDEQLDDLTRELEQIAVSWEDPQLMMTVPGIGPVIAVTIKGEVGEFERFDHKTEVVSYAGLDPAVRASGEKETTGEITKEGSSTLRWALGQGALNAKRYDPYLGNYFTRLAEHKPKKKALVATARKLLVMIYAMISKQEAYDPPEGATAPS